MHVTKTTPQTRLVALAFAAACAGDDGTHLFHQDDAPDIPCSEDAITAVPAADVPFDMAAVAERSGTLRAPGEWAAGGATEVSVEVAVRSDVAYRITPEDTTCPDVERWKVDVDVTVGTEDAVLAHTWTERTSAEATAAWSLGTVFDEDDAATLRAAAGYPATDAPYASISLTWAEGVHGSIQTLAAGDHTDASEPVLTFE